MNYYLTRDKEFQVYGVHKAEEPPKPDEDGDFLVNGNPLLACREFEHVFPSEYHLEPGQVAELDLCKIGFQLIEDTVKTAEETYLYWHKRSGICKGDKARVVREAADHEGGWTRAWNPQKNWMIGKAASVERDLGDMGFELEDGNYYPYFVLEKI